MSVQAVLFDMDGVLVDAREWHYQALNRALAMHGFTITPDEHLDRYDGLPTRVKLVQLTQEKGLPVELYEQINKAKQRFTIEEIELRARPTAHHIKLLRELKRLNLSVALCSNARRETVDLILERVALAPLLDLVLSADDVLRTKPDPEIYETAMRRLALPPDACLLVEDSPFGVRAARASGGHVLVVAGPDDVACERVLAELHCIASATARSNERRELAYHAPLSYVAARQRYGSPGLAHHGAERASRDSYRP